MSFIFSTCSISTPDRNRIDWFIQSNPYQSNSNTLKVIEGAQDRLFNLIKNRLGLNPDIIEFSKGKIIHQKITDAYEIKTIQEHILLSKTIIDCNGKILLHEEYFKESNRFNNVKEVFLDIFPVLYYISCYEQEAAKDFPSIGFNDSTFEINANEKDERTQELLGNWIKSSIDNVIENTKGGEFI